MSGLWGAGLREPTGATVWPLDEEDRHVLDGDEAFDCPCRPAVEWIDRDTGLPYENGPFVIHNELERQA